MTIVINLNLNINMKNTDKLAWLVKTPSDIVNLILDHVGYTWKWILRKKILEPASWDGNFLIEIVTRYIYEAKKENISDIDISKELNQYIYAWELQKHLMLESIDKLNVILDNNNIPHIKWDNFKIVNSIIEGNKETNKFDYIVWNPPYIRVQNLSKEDRQIIKDNSTICAKWAMDMYIPFFELGFNLLVKGWKLWYITPNTLLKTKSAKVLRNFLMNNTNLLKLIDFKEHQIFNATTYSLIMILEKSNIIDNSHVELYNSDKTFKLEKIWNIDIIKQWDHIWNLLESNILSKIEKIEKKGIKLWTLTRISTGLWTLADAVYIHKIENFNKNKKTQSIFVNDIHYEIETKILKHIIKASTLKKSNIDQHLYIIFPYLKDDNDKNQIIQEDILKEEYPLAYKYLLQSKNQLLLRDKWKKNKVAWYAFGRTQGLDHSFGKKIITSTMNKTPNFMYIDDEYTTFISGYSITIPPIISKEELLTQLNSDNMDFYIKNISRDYRWWYKAYSKAYIENFWITIE